MHLTKEQITSRFTDLQNSICQGLQALNGNTPFDQEIWERQGGGGGRTRIVQNGTVIEKGGVNFSAVHGAIPPTIAQALQLPAHEQFYATGVSIVLHPHSPLMPIIHMNVRYFEISDGQYWFGGGIDLTPHYVVPADAQFFHQQLQAACQKHHPAYYPRFKQWADEYFYLKHRQETRGIGGIFFDRLTQTEDQSKNQIFEFVYEIGNLFVPIYAYFVTRYAHLPFTPQQQEWQLLRRSRYVEFNLIYDKGTKFGLDTDGRTESILMSMPPLAKWAYNYLPPAGSHEAQTLNWLKKGINWAEQKLVWQPLKTKKMKAILQSTITCPHCGYKKEETMPTDACQYFYECENCKKICKPKPGDCCVYCSYGTVKCPPIQMGANCCNKT